MSAWKMEYQQRADAQTFADRVHQWMISNNVHYARSVSIGQTLRWAFPYQEENGTLWNVNIKDRSFNALTTPEKSDAKIFDVPEMTIKRLR